ncbi:MAG: Na/Pi cotransporter family protein [Nitratireductor sp.]|nr:Na/Pi cotransporter family protein [Nitratireductor sp.]
MQVLIFLLQLSGAVLLLLYSTRMVRTGVERLAGPSLRDLFRGTRKSLMLNVVLGGVAAVLLQSSTAVAMLASSFAANGAMGVTGSIAVVLGADLGTSLVVQFLSLDLSWLVPVLLTAGGVLFLKTESRHLKQIGRILFGVAFILLSLRMLGEASGPIKESRHFPAVISVLAQDPVTAFLSGGLIAFLFHSSVATVLLLAVFCSQGVLPLAAALPLVLGANMGSGVVGIWLTRNMGIKARRITTANLFFRAAGGLAALALLMADVLPLDRLGVEPARQIVNFHLAFNLALAVLGLPFVVAMARLVKWIIREAPQEVDPAARPASALDESVLGQPQLALASATRELLRMSEHIERMFDPLMDVFDAPTEAQIKRIRDMDEGINQSQNEIKLYLARLNQGELTREQAERSMELTNFAISLERVGDIISKDLLRLCDVKRRKGLQFSEEGRKELMTFHGRARTNIRLALNVLISEDLESATQLAGEKETMRQMERRSHDSHIRRLGTGNAQSIATSDIHIEAIQGIKEINSRFISFAYPILSRYGVLMESRVAKG